MIRLRFHFSHTEAHPAIERLAALLPRALPRFNTEKYNIRLAVEAAYETLPDIMKEARTVCEPFPDAKQLLTEITLHTGLPGSRADCRELKHAINRYIVAIAVHDSRLVLRISISDPGSLGEGVFVFQSYARKVLQEQFQKVRV